LAILSAPRIQLIPLNAAGGLSQERAVEQVLQLPKHGVYHLVLGAPLMVDADAFKRPLMAG